MSVVHWTVTFDSYLGKTYTVSIYDDSWTGNVVPLTPGAVPFFTEDNKNADILTPMRTQTGYLRVVAEDDLTALYPTTPTSRPVMVRDEDNTLVWHGYIGCESYAQPWDTPPYELELPLVSSIGVLKYLEVAKDEIADRAHIAYYINTAITKSGGNFDTLVFPASFTLDSWSTDVFLRLGVQERNWFSYTNENMYDKTYPRYDGMTWYQVLESICETFGLTLYERGTTLYLVQRGELRGQQSVAVDDLPAYDWTLPYDAQVEYLETDGNAYVNIGIKASSTVQFNIDMYLPTSSANSWAFGGRYSASQRSLCVLFDVVISGKIVWRFGNTSNNCSAISVGNYNLNNMTAANTLQVNGSSYSATNSTFSTDAYIYLFTCNNNNSTIVNPPAYGMRFFKGKFYSSGTLVRDFIPVRKNGVGYLYDKVSGELFGNAASSGAFTYGADVISGDTPTTTTVTSTDVAMTSLTISDKNGKVNTSMPARRVVVESQVNSISDDSFPQMSTLYLQYGGAVQVAKAYTDTSQGATGNYYEEEVGVYEPTTEGANIWAFSSYYDGSETTWSGQDIARDYSISAYVRRSSGDDAIMFVFNNVPGATGYPKSYFSIKSASSATYLGGKIVIKCNLAAYEGEGLSLNHMMEMKLRIGSYYWTGSEWTTTDSTFTAYFNSSTNKLSDGFYSDKDGFRIALPTDASIYGDAEITMWTPLPQWVQSNGVEGVYMIENLKMSYEHPEGSVFGDHPVSDTNRFAMDLNTYGDEKSISPNLSSYIYWRFGYGVLLKPDYSGAVEKVDIGQSQAHTETEVYLEQNLLWAMEYYYSTTQRDIDMPVRTSTIYSPLTFFIDQDNNSHYFLSQSTNWRDDEQTIKIFDNL